VGPVRADRALGGYRDIRHLAGEEVVLGREEGDIVFRDDAFMSAATRP